MKRPATDMLLGAHVSAAGGSWCAPPRSAAIGASVMQLFTKQGNRWAEREVDEEEVSAFRSARVDAGQVLICAHDSYLINLASPDDVLRVRSLLSFIAEFRRCARLGIDFVVSHPGNYMDDRVSGLVRNAEAIVAALECVPGSTMLLLETTAGSGTVLGARFEELAAIIEYLPPALRPRVGVCMDTAHVFAAGYDLAGDYDGVLAQFDDLIGLDRLRALHMNDSKAPLGSRRDRHELIGEGALGDAPFRRIMTDDRLTRVPKILETPKLDDAERTDRRMLRKLRSFAEG